MYLQSIKANCFIESFNIKIATWYHLFTFKSMVLPITEYCDIIYETQ